MAEQRLERLESGAEIFAPALAELDGENSRFVYGPESLLKYLSRIGKSAKTAPSISVDSYEALPRYLKMQETMVFRLGVSEGGGNTQFALVRLKGHLRDLFLFDQEVFEDERGATFLPNVSMRRLFTFQLLPAFSEGALVNLALASGVLGQALRFSDMESPLPPATGHSTFSFIFAPHSAYDLTFNHNRGQVEIDALWVDRRDGRDCLFIVEAKAGIKERLLAKHKLVYPILALAPHLPKDMEIVPVYLKAFLADDGIHFQVLECEYPEPRSPKPAVDHLKPRTHHHLILPMFRP